MTALPEYARLEAPGLWRAAPDQQRRDVIVSLGEASVTITDMTDTALAHWSLAAVERLNPGERPALYAPGADASEELEVGEETMVEAIERVRRAVRRRRARPGRLRLVAVLAVSLAIAAIAVLWLPGALVAYAAAIVPDAKRAEIGSAMLTRIERVAGRPCNSPSGRRALDALAARLVPGRRLLVLPDGLRDALVLPGGTMLVRRVLVEDFDSPEVLAGHVLAEDLRAAAEDPLRRLLKDAGLRVAVGLLTTGDIPMPVLARHAERLLAETPPPPPEDALLARMDAAGVSSRPYAFALDISGETTLGLIEADPHPEGSTPPLMSDGAWIALQSICEG